ncbi:MAG: hypothetical protein AB2598_11180 [Candidatus Thiodiazotropha sp.]
MSNSDSSLPDEYAENQESTKTSDRVRVTLEIAVAALILVGIYYLFAPDEEIDLAPLKESQIDPIIRAQIDSATQQTTPAPSPTIPDEQPIDSDAGAASGEEQPLQVATVTADAGSTESDPGEGGFARELISRLRSGQASITPEQLLEQVTRYQDEDRPTDAYLLLFYAAREGNGMAAFTLAGMHDPNHFAAGNPLLENPDAYQAHKWYSAALDEGISEARERLSALRKRAEEQAKNGDLAAQRLLLNWR